MSIIKWIDDMFYSNYDDNWDDELFRQRILSYLTEKSIVLDIGAGAGIVKQMNFRGKVARICGIDLDPRVSDNVFLDEGIIANAEQIPYADDTFDIVFADNVLEHLDNPQMVFIEIHRVLKPGGVLLFKTPNRNHYMPVIARLTPHRWHQYFNRLRGREIVDTFPTHYLANSVKQIKNLADKTSFECKLIDLIEGRPEYLRFSAITYLIGMAYEKWVNSNKIFENWRILLVAELKKPESSSR